MYTLQVQGVVGFRFVSHNLPEKTWVTLAKCSNYCNPILIIIIAFNSLLKTALRHA